MKSKSGPQTQGVESKKRRLGVDLASDYFNELDNLCKICGYSTNNEAVRAMIELHSELAAQAKLGFRPAVQHVKSKEVIAMHGNCLSLLALRAASDQS